MTCLVSGQRSLASRPRALTVANFQEVTLQKIIEEGANNGDDGEAADGVS
jgi:hypothetical protein